MRFKYYLRGAGMGIIVTTVILMIAFSRYVKNMPVQESTSTGNGKTIEQAIAMQNAEDQEESEDTQKAEKPQAQEQPKTQEEPQTQGEPQTQEQPQTQGASQGQEDNRDTEEEYVMVVIRAGEFSDVVSNNLEKAGLVKNGEKYNKWLMKHHYDSDIQPGKYRIKVGATYKEIAEMITEHQ